jgi:hypothetical protein
MYPVETFGSLHIVIIAGACLIIPRDEERNMIDRPRASGLEALKI